MNKWRENWEHEHGQINRNQTNKKQYGRAEQRTNRVTLNLSCLIISPIIMMADNMIDRMNILYVHVIDTLWCFDWQKIDEHFCVEASQICFLYATGYASDYDCNICILTEIFVWIVRIDAIICGALQWWGQVSYKRVWAVATFISKSREITF